MNKLGKDLLEFMKQVDDLIIDERIKNNFSFHLKGLESVSDSTWGYYDDADYEIRLDRELDIRFPLTCNEKPKLLSVNATYGNCYICRRIEDFKKYYYLAKQHMILFNEFAKKLENAKKLNDMKPDFE